MPECCEGAFSPTIWNRIAAFRAAAAKEGNFLGIERFLTLHGRENQHGDTAETQDASPRTRCGSLAYLMLQ